MFFYFIRTRDELLIQLKKQQNKELEKNLQLIEYSKKEAGKLKGAERQKRIKKIKKARKEIVKRIRTKQRGQRAVFKKFRKLGKKQEAINMMKKWEKEGYEMPELKKEKAINFKNQISEWKKEGYKTDVLKK